MGQHLWWTRTVDAPKSIRKLGIPKSNQHKNGKPGGHEKCITNHFRTHSASNRSVKAWVIRVFAYSTTSRRVTLCTAKNMEGELSEAEGEGQLGRPSHHFAIILWVRFAIGVTHGRLASDRLCQGGR